VGGCAPCPLGLDSTAGSTAAAACYLCALGKYSGALEHDETCTLCEAGKYRADSNDVNWARTCGADRQQACSTSQSSTGWGGWSGRVVDNNFNSVYADGNSCNQLGIQDGTATWWSVGLGDEPIRITGFLIRGRSDADTEHTQGFSIFVGNDVANDGLFANHSVCVLGQEHLTGTSNEDVRCAEPISGRHVVFHVPSGALFSLCELVVLSTDCARCPTHAVSEPGSDAVGDCVCAAGATGPDGQECAPCAAGKYKPGNGTAACADCGPGTYSETGAVLCTQCYGGTYESRNASAACSLCPVGVGFGNNSRRGGLSERSCKLFYAPMLVPSYTELAQIDFAHVLHGSNDGFAEDWQRLFVLVGLEARQRAAELRGCSYRVRLAALGPNASSGILLSPDVSRLRELGCSMSLDEYGIGECHLAVPTALALVHPHQLVALTAEVAPGSGVAEQERCEWPEEDLFTASLVPYATQLTCAHAHFWSEDVQQCVPCELANSELVANVCGPGRYIRGCDAISHLNSNVTDECQACQDNGNRMESYEWHGSVCQWQCREGFFLNANARCEACSTSLQATCATSAGLQWWACSRVANEACVPCAPVRRGLYSGNEEFAPATPT